MAKKQSQLSRRTILKTGGILAVGGISATGLGASQQNYSVEIKQYPEEEYVVITNVDPEVDADITGFSINFDAEDDDYNQVRELAGEVVLAAGESVTVPTGAREVDADNIVELADPYDGEVLNNDGSDVVTLLDTDGQVVWSTTDNTTYTLTLTVIGPDEEVVPDASVGIVTYEGGAPVTSGTTDENGQATFELRNGGYELSVSTDGYVNPSDDRLVGINGEDVDRTIQLVRYGRGPDEEDETNGDEEDGMNGDEDDGSSGDSDEEDETNGDSDEDDSDGSTDGSGDSEGSDTTDEKDCPSR